MIKGGDKVLAAKILFIILLLFKFYNFGSFVNGKTEQNIEMLKDKTKFFSDEINEIIMNITKSFAMIMLLFNIVILWLSLMILKDNWLSIIPIVSTILANLDILIFKCKDVKEYVNMLEQRGKRINYIYESINFISLLVWYGVMIIVC